MLRSSHFRTRWLTLVSVFPTGTWAMTWEDPYWSTLKNLGLGTVLGPQLCLNTSCMMLRAYSRFSADGLSKIERWTLNEWLKPLQWLRWFMSQSHAHGSWQQAQTPKRKLAKTGHNFIQLNTTVNTAPEKIARWISKAQARAGRTRLPLMRQQHVWHGTEGRRIGIPGSTEMKGRTSVTPHHAMWVTKWELHWFTGNWQPIKITSLSVSQSFFQFKMSVFVNDRKETGSYFIKVKKFKAKPAGIR